MRKTISVLGQGYVGLELSIAAAKAGHQVYAIDKSAERIEHLETGHSPVENVSNKDLLSVLESQKYRPTIDFTRVRECEIVVICVPTPLTLRGEPDLKYLTGAVEDIAHELQSGTLIINESTSFPGTLRNFIIPKIEELRPDLKGMLSYAVAPERVSPGNLIPLREIARVVSGIDEDSTQRAVEFYGSFCQSVKAAESPEIAEMAKLLENSFRQVNIAFINEFNVICRKLGIDTRQVIEAAKTKPYGFMPFQPSAGIGGHCIPVDPMYLQMAAKNVNSPSSLVAASFSSNLSHTSEICGLVMSQMRTKKVNSVLLLGVAYKSGLSDTRESPAKRIAEYFESKSISVGWIDPLVENFRGKNPSSLDENWDCALIVTHQDYLPIDILLDREIPLFDFTGIYRLNPKIIQI